MTRLTRLLALSLTSLLVGGGCTPSPGEARPRAIEEVRGTMVDLVFAFEADVAVRVDTGDETVKLLADQDTVVSVSGLSVSLGALPESVGLPLTAFCRRERAWCLDTRFIEIELAPGGPRGHRDRPNGLKERR